MRFSRPRGTPQPVLDKLSAALDTALDELVKSEIAKWTPILKAASGL